VVFDPVAPEGALGGVDGGGVAEGDFGGDVATAEPLGLPVAGTVDGGEAVGEADAKVAADD
jgi:hypothetical protein